MLWLWLLLLCCRLGRGRAVQARNNPQGIKAKTRLRQAPLTHLTLRVSTRADEKKEKKINQKGWQTGSIAVIASHD